MPLERALLLLRKLRPSPNELYLPQSSQYVLALVLTTT
eukprot:CAMPEP_0173261528 /NCGR_PEP_ID=MMETSP1142-20121109/26241_1 /TAXON_ID=483371 /ORGANISM="non described non described, Strain CCMP2298" /LENGTH=37 /DNA_ID= /DNA_START= /DNA_END= /DNA_ORIENTATION=